MAKEKIPMWKKGLNALRRGLALVCAALVVGAVSATELEYSGGVYCYGTYRGGGANEGILESATPYFELDVAPDSFPGKSESHVAVPVVLRSGAVTSESVAISLEGVAHPGELSTAKIYDDRAFMKMVCPADSSKWEDGGDGWEYEKGNEYRRWPRDVWPDKVPVSNRYWVLAQVNAGRNWSGLTHLRVAVRDDVHGSFAPVVVPLLRGGVAEDFPGDRIFGGSDMTVKPLSKSWWVTFRSDLTWTDDSARPWFDYCTASDGGSMPIDVRGAGVLRVVYIIEGDDELRVRGKNVVTSGVTVQDWPTRCLEVEVSAATTLTVYNEDWSDVYIREISFWPSGSRCVRVAADYVERCGLDDGCGLPYLRGYVLGSGVYRSGETATLTAVAGNAAAFVRWESDDVAIDSAAATNACLSFTVPDSVCAAAAARAEVRIRAVWRDRLPGEVGPNPSYTFVPGEPVSLDIPDLVGYAAKGLPAGLKFDSKTGRIAGAAAKPTGEAGVTVTFTKKGAETYTTQIVVGPFPVLSVSAPDAPASCRVTGAGAYAAGKKVTLKATAAKGFVFAGWYADADFETPLAGDVDFRTPSMPYVMPKEDVTLFARFVPVDEDAAVLLLPPVASEYAPNEAVELALDVSGCVSLPTVKVAGLPPGLKFTAKALDVKATKTATAAHYAANTIYGAPTKSGVYAATVTVTTAGKRTATETVLFAVVDRDRGEYVLKIASDVTKGKVTGAGVYAAGKKVALRAAPAKGYIFAGWYGADGHLLQGDGDIDWRTPSITYAMPGSDVTVHARFIPAEEDGGIALSVNGQTATEAASGVRFSTSGELSLALCVESASLPKVAIWGLPAGLKFTAKRIRNKDGSVLAEANTVYGTATRPGTYVVTAKITNATVKKAVEFRFTVVVDNLTGANGLLLVTDAASGEPIPLRNARGEKYTVYAGVEKHELPAITPFEESDKLTVSGLPAGLRYDAKLRKFTGVPTKAGTYTVTATVRSGRVSSVSTFTVEVVALPEWAVGTFGGEVDRPNADAEDESDEWRKYGTVTLTVSSAGKVTAKVLAGGKAWSFSANGFAAHDAARDSYRFRMETRTGDVFEGEIVRDYHDIAALMGEWQWDGGIDPEGTFAPADCEPYHIIIWRNENGRDGRLDADETGRARTALDAVKAAGRFALADFDPAWGTVAVAVDARGNVKASGTTADGVKVSASGGFLALDDADPYMCASLVFYDRKTGLVYDCSPSWQPDFDENGNLAGSAEDWFVPIHCDPYPFE